MADSVGINVDDGTGTGGTFGLVVDMAFNGAGCIWRTLAGDFQVWVDTLGNPRLKLIRPGPTGPILNPVLNDSDGFAIANLCNPGPRVGAYGTMPDPVANNGSLAINLSRLCLQWATGGKWKTIAVFSAVPLGYDGP